MECFDHPHLFHTVTCRVYGHLEVVQLMSLTLLWKPLGDWLLFICARTSRGPIVLMSSDLRFSPTTALELYCVRTRIETMFQELEAHLHSEINTLGYPKAALFGFCVALVAYNVLAVVKAALRTIHGEETIDHELSGYYLAGNIARTHDGMMIALPESEWAVFQTMPPSKLAEVLLQLAENVNLSQFKNLLVVRKKKPPKRDKYSKHNHVSTAKLLKGKKPRE